MIVSETLAFSLAKFAYAQSQHKAGHMETDDMWKVCDELADAIRRNDAIHDMTRNERARRYGWHPREI
jgi:hypothetical protein